MKNLFKFTSAALALVAFASCSNDDLLGGQNIAGQGDKGTLVVNVEPLSDGFRSSTRALSNDAMTSLNFEASDKIKVYDSEVHKWDGYKFNTSSKKFELFTESDLTAPVYALYPFGVGAKDIDGQSETGGTTGVVGTNWSKGGETTATMAIPAEYSYKESTLADGSNGYWCNLPMWGTVTSTEGKLETNLKYMTAVLRVSLKNVTSSDIDHLRIQAFKDEARTKQINLSGNFEAVLDTENPANTELQETLGNGEIIVNLANAKNSDSYVFVPIVPCTNAIVVIKYENDAYAAVPGKDGKTEKVLSQKNYVRGTLYKAKGAEFDVNIGAPSAISQVLAGAKSETEPVDVEATVITETNPVVAGATTDDNVITIPSGMTADITLNLKGINTANGTLYIEDENSSNPYTGNLTIITEASTGVDGIVAQLKGAAVKFVGDFKTNKIDAFVQDLVIGEAEKTTKVTLGGVGDLLAENNIGTMVEAITIAKDATVPAITAPADNKLAEILVEGVVTGKITATANKDVATAITIDGGEVQGTGAPVQTLGNITVKGEAKILNGTIKNMAAEDVTYPIAINVSGKAQVRAISTADNNAAATINVTEEATVTSGTINAKNSIVTLDNSVATTYNGAITADKLTVKGKSKVTGAVNKVTVNELTVNGEGSVENATVKGTVLVKRSKEGEAITGTLTIPAENNEGQTIGMVTGYVNEINLSAATNDVQLLFSKKNEGLVAVANVVPSATVKLVPTVSKWNGKTIAAEFSKYAEATQIWSASQLASMAGNAASKQLMNDIDLGTAETWTMPALLRDFNGNGHTITGGKIVAKDDLGTGLFATATGDREIRDLTFTGATITSAGKKNIGTLIGAMGGAIYVKKTTVNATLNVTGDAEFVGGLVGQAGGKATIGQAGETTDVNVTLSALAGRYFLGGLVGICVGAEINKTTVAITNGITFTPTKKEPTVEDATDTKAGSIGMFIGKSTENVVIDAANPAANDQIKGKRANLGFKLNFTGTAPNINYYFGGQSTEVGLLEPAKTLTIGTGATAKTYNSLAIAADGTTAFEGSGDDKDQEINWSGKDKSNAYTANASFNIYVTSKGYSATDK